MSNATARSTVTKRPLRLWPGVVAAVLVLVSWFVVPVVAPDVKPFDMLAAVLLGLLIIVWWVFLSRAAWLERLSALGLMIVALVATRPLLHASIATAGMGVLFPIYAVPFLAVVFVIWAVATRNLADRTRRLTMVATILIGCGFWTLLRTGGINNQGESDLGWRWSETPEEQLLASVDGESAAITPPTRRPSDAVPEWPGFRGPDRDSVIRGVWIETDWGRSPPVELWRRPVGPGWSSFAVHGNLLFTQEQRGEHETVTCYDLATGAPVWQHRDSTRFWESNAGAGPRATPTLSDGRLYSFGATGILNALDASTGAVFWSRDVSRDTEVKVPTWGFASSPLVVDDVVVVAAAGRLAAYEVATGQPRWFGPDGGDSYSSPHPLTIDGVRQILLMSITGAVSIAPADGELLWEHPWPGSTRIVQPASTASGDILMSRGGTSGLRRLAVSDSPLGWTLEERWTSNRLKPYFSDFVVHRGHAYGFDGNILACIDIESGERSWKGGRYGSGQLVLLAEQDLLLVVSEKGELALVGANPDGFTELARFPAIEGKTWNHPVMVGDILLVRNDHEMVAFRL